VFATLSLLFSFIIIGCGNIIDTWEGNDPPIISTGTELTGTVGPITIADDVVIPQNTTTMLNGSSLVDLRQTFVDGDVQGEGTRSVIVGAFPQVMGNVQITEAAASAGVYALQLDAAVVDGDVQVEKSAGRLRAKESRNGGNLQFVENDTGPYWITDNTINGDLQFFKNRGECTITGNEVGGNLQSKENNPLPTITGNLVEGDLEIE
jgi:hypothetical protein